MPYATDAKGGPRAVTPEEIQAIAAEARERKPADEAARFDIILEGTTPTGDPEAAREKVQPLAEAGATWWIESPWETASVASLRARIAAGPPGRG
jgi:hypothetical protein